MNTAVVNVKVNPEVKKKAQKVAEELGFSLSSLINGYLRQLVRTREIQFNMEEPSDYLVKTLKESEADIKAGRVVSFSSWEEEEKYLQKLIDDDQKHKSR